LCFVTSNKKNYLHVYTAFKLCQFYHEIQTINGHNLKAVYTCKYFFLLEVTKHKAIVWKACNK